MIVGLDMGGTHIDGVILKNGEILKTVKNPAHQEDLFQSIWTTLEELLIDIDKNQIKRINLSTTVSTNAIAEKKTAPVGMIIQRGPGLSHDFEDCIGEKVFISGYIDHRGQKVKDFPREEIEEAKALFRRKGINACAVVAKFSPRNPIHELVIKELLEDEFAPITLGHTLSGKLNFPRRVHTSYLNAAVSPTFQNFANNLKKSLVKAQINAPVFILKADGGTMNLATAEEMPVETILSGPAASMVGLTSLCDHSEQDRVLLDIGGTTTDIFFMADGVPLFEPLGIEINGYKTLVRAIYSASIGLGGDSAITVIGGELKIGPQRHGPPYAFGGPQPTPTDGMLALGLMEGQQEEQARALAAMESLGSSLGLTGTAIARKILDTMAQELKSTVDQLLEKLNNRPVYTIAELLSGKKIEPQVINIIGGPAAPLAPIISEKFGLPSRFPKHHQVANAIGAALAKITTEITILVDTARGILSVPELEIYEEIPRKFSLEKAKDQALFLLEQRAIEWGEDPSLVEGEIIEESSYNMVRGFSTSGQNIRVKAQLKPILNRRWGRGEDN